MSPSDFAYWLTGYFEISDSNNLSPQQVQIIRDHLALVFEKVTPDRKGYEPLDTRSTGLSAIGLCGQPQEIDWTKLPKMKSYKVETRYC
jgi:hypothetical protein